MRHPILSLAVLAIGITLAFPSDAQRRRRAPAENGEMLAQSCFGCHGPSGVSYASVMPAIGGQGASYLDYSLRAFRDGQRPSTIMGRLMKGYSDPEILAMATYLGGLPFKRQPQAADPDKARQGKTFYDKTCKRCHPDGGRESSEPDYPLMAGQGLAYMQAAIADILAGRRIVDDKFGAKLGELNAEEIDTVLHFFASEAPR
jgi:sulfide dehydrogenase cytochrome subunit